MRPSGRFPARRACDFSDLGSTAGALLSSCGQTRKFFPDVDFQETSRSREPSWKDAQCLSLRRFPKSKPSLCNPIYSFAKEHGD